MRRKGLCEDADAYWLRPGLLRGHKALALSAFALATQCECINKQIVDIFAEEAE